MNETNHKSKSEFYAFQHDLLNQKEKEEFLEHICSCDYCSDQFAAMMSEVVIEAPKNLKENILQATRRPEVQLAIRVKETSKRMKLFIYSLKVGTATAVALLLLLLTMNTSSIMNQAKTDMAPVKEAIQQEDKIPLATVIRDNMDALTDSILNFSNKIMNTEVTNND